MSARKTLASLKPMGDINLTPLMDLTFILLITFIITFPLLEHGIEINLPRATAGDLASETARTIAMDAKGALHLDDRPIAFEELRAALVEMGRLSPDVTVLIRADERLPYGDVVRILKLLHEANLARMALVTRAEER